jgi:small GTP-binding protein
MIQKKICLLGAFSVGKTSLIKRYVDSLFDDRYLTTVGVKIDKKSLTVEDKQINLMIWDLAGDDDFSQLNMSYMRGAAGYILVIDPTRANTLDTALQVHSRVESALGKLPVLIALNKSDLQHDWTLNQEHFRQLNLLDLPIVHTSAKYGDEVDTLFQQLASAMLK